MLPVCLDSPFLIAPSVFSNVYLMKEKPPLHHISYFVMTGSCTFFSAGNTNYTIIECIIQRVANNLYIQPERLYIQLFAVNV